MNDEAVLEQAHRAGLAIDWIDAADRPQRVSIQSLRRILDALGPQETVEPSLVTGTIGKRISLPGLKEDAAASLELEDGTHQSLRLRAGEELSPLPPGYHTLRYGKRELTLAIAPPRCLTATDIAQGRKLWGLATQVYSLRRPGDGGIGDTTAIAELVVAAAQQGADALALSPMHSLFPSDLSRYSPYAPSSRLFVNPLLVDPAAALGHERVVAGTEEARESTLIDWPTVAAAKYAKLSSLFQDFALRDLAQHTALAGRFNAFVQTAGAALADHARFEAERSGGSTPVLFHFFLQWLAHEGLAGAQAAAREAGMKIGLISDLAVGLDREGTEVKARPGDYLAGLSVGAPPDLFNASGQDWGLTSFSPKGLKASGYAAFIATLRAALRNAGGVRIDHALGLMRLWVVPNGAASADGAYLAYPFEDLLRLLALESHRHKAIVIGEDLGTVPPRFREHLHKAGIAGMDVLWFQRDENGFLPPEKWREDAVAMSTTHDLPTIAGWWRGSDLETRLALGKASDEEAQQRPAERKMLWQGFVEAGIAPAPAPALDETDRVVDAALEYVASAPATLALIPLEDITGSIEQPNLPGTIDEHPNWRRRFQLPTTELLQKLERRTAILDRRKT